MSNFICEKCGMTNIDCGYQGYKTKREIELEKQLDREIHINRKMKRVLEEYADKDNWEYYNLNNSDKCLIGAYQNCEPNEVGFEPALQVLKEIENKE